MRAQQGFEHLALIEIDEAIQVLCVLAQVVMYVNENRAAERPCGSQDRRSYRDPIADAGNLDQHFVRVANEQRSPQRADHAPIPAGTPRWAR